jgi:septal ring factor EnvC (AmiA/AmiB activator)
VTSRFREYASDLLKNYGERQSNLLDGKFEFNINIDNGIQVKGLLASLAGGALMAWNPGGWVVLTLGAISVLVSLGKALIGFFSSDYKMSQQRKSVDSNLSSITDSMRESIQKNLAEAFVELEKKIKEIKEELAVPTRQVVQINASLVKSVVELEKLSLSI